MVFLEVFKDVLYLIRTETQYNLITIVWLCFYFLLKNQNLALRSLDLFFRVKEFDSALGESGLNLLNIRKLCFAGVPGMLLTYTKNSLQIDWELWEPSTQLFL